MTFSVADIPAASFVVEPPERVDLEKYDTASASLLDPNRAEIVALDASIDADAGTVTVEPPTESPFETSGIYRLRVTLTGTGTRATLPDLRIVVQDPASEWHTLDSLRDDWTDAEDISDVMLWSVLELAREQVLEFAPVVAVDDPVPSRYVDAQRIQARNIVTAGRVSPDGGSGEGDFVIRPFPLDWHVRQILRPKSARPVIA